MKKKLKEICVFYSGTGFPTQYQGEIEGEYPFYKVGDIANNVTAGKKYLELCKNYISPDVAKTIKGCILPKDTVVFAKIGEALKLNRRAITSCDCLIDNNAMGIAPNGEYLRIQYFYFFMKNLKMQSLAESTTVPSVRKTKLEDYEIEVPSLDEQEEIEAKLSLTAEIIKKEKEELKKLDDLIKARFVEMFGDSASNEKGWKMNTFGDICTVRQGLQIPISKRLTEYEEDSYEYITVQYLHGGKEKEYIKSPKESVKCTKDDILMTRTGNTGMVVTNVEGVFHNNFFLIDFDRERFEKDFLVEYLNLDLIQADITRRAGTSTIPDLNHGEFYKIKVFEPPIDLQKEFDEFKMQVDKSKVAVQKALDETQTLFDSLMQEYFG